jgi:hypothetical protein
MRWSRPESLDDGQGDAVSKQRVRIAIRIRLQSDLTESRLNGRKLSAVAIGYAIVSRQQSVWSRRWHGIPPFSCLNERSRLVAVC